MLKNYLKISWRNLVRNRAYTTINVVGLALSMACGILIFMLVSFNLSFDNFHPNANRIYRIVTENHRDPINYVASTPPPLGKYLRDNYTYTEQVARIVNIDDATINVNDGRNIKAFKEKDGINFVEPSFFKIFNFPLVQGNMATALSQPNTAVITQNIAEKYFGKADAIGQIFALNGRLNITVTGVLKNLPPNTDQKGELYLSYLTLKTSGRNFYISDSSWGGMSSDLKCYALLRPGVSPAAIENLSPTLVKKFRPNSRFVHFYKMQPLADVHFNALYGGVMSKRTLWILSFIGIFIIVTACVNFINLATAQALKRSKEVGVRKVLGSMQRQLFWQFIIETAMIVAVSLTVALFIAMPLLPFLNTLFKIDMPSAIWSNGPLLIFLLALAFVITLLAGAYPGIILANFKPVAALKGKVSQQNIGGFNTRRGLIIAQFAISQVLITGMIIIAVQMHYAKDSGLGFNKDAVLMVPMGIDSTGTTAKAFKDAVMKIPGVQNISACFAAPASSDNENAGVRYNHDAEDESFALSLKAADEQYVSLFDLELVAGHNITPSDTLREFIVNEAFVRKLNIANPQDVLGKTLMADGVMKAPIVGVVKDFHDRSFKADINAVAIYAKYDHIASYAVKISMNNAGSEIAAIGKAWTGIYTNQVYDPQFLDEQVAGFYQTEQTMLALIQGFTVLAIFIGGLGLYGLVMFMAVQKTKEIGIRKVLGSTVAEILWIFGKEFSRLIVIAFVIAAPIAWWLMNNWLQDFKFHITISPLFFGATLLLMFIIAFITVGYQSIKAALMNPVVALKTE